MAAPRSLTVFSSSVLQTPPPDAAFAFIVTTAGGNYCGLQKGDESLGLETLVLFDDHLGSTLGIRLSEFSYCKVLQRLEESAKLWARGALAAGPAFPSNSAEFKHLHSRTR